MPGVLGTPQGHHGDTTGTCPQPCSWQGRLCRQARLFWGKKKKTFLAPNLAPLRRSPLRLRLPGNVQPWRRARRSSPRHFGEHQPEHMARLCNDLFAALLHAPSAAREDAKASIPAQKLGKVWEEQPWSWAGAGLQGGEATRSCSQPAHGDGVWRSQPSFQAYFRRRSPAGSPGRPSNARLLTRGPELIDRSGCLNEDSACAGGAGERPGFGAGHIQFVLAAALGSSISPFLAFLIKSVPGWATGCWAGDWGAGLGTGGAGCALHLQGQGGQRLAKPISSLANST